MSEDPEDRGVAARVAAARHLMAEHLSRRGTAAAQSPSDLLAAHPELTQELRDELERLHMIESARQAAAQAEPAVDVEPVTPGDGAALLHAASLTWHQLLSPPQAAGELGRIGRYPVFEVLGEGAMGTVLRGEHPVLGRAVAIKVMAAHLVGNPHAAGRFSRELRALARLHHPNIVHAYDADALANTLFFVMEYVPGINLTQLVKRDGPLPLELACDYIRQAAAGLQHAHEAGLVHRDVKPSNLLRTPQGQVKLLDLGLSRMVEEIESGDRTSSSVVLGTPDFMAPEQAINAHDADVRADIYSLGSTFYYLLVGRTPFPVSTAVEKLLAHQLREPEPLCKLRPEVPAALADLVGKMMAKAPGLRFQTPAEVVGAIDAFLRTVPAPMHLPAPPAEVSAPPSDVRPQRRSVTPLLPTVRQLRLYFVCPGCQKSLSVPLESAGNLDVCPVCSAKLQVPALEAGVAGFDLLPTTHGGAKPKPTRDAETALQPLDELAVTQIELHGLQDEIEWRFALARIQVERLLQAELQPRQAGETASQYMARLLKQVSLAEQRRHTWVMGHVQPLWRRAAQRRRQATRVSDLEFRLGACPRDPSRLQVVIHSRKEPDLNPTTARLDVDAQAAQHISLHWDRLHKTARVGFGLSTRRQVRELTLLDTDAVAKYETIPDEFLTQLPEPVTALAIGPNGRYLAAASSSVLEIHDLFAGQRVARLRSAGVCSLRFHPDAAVLAVAGSQCALWDVKLGQFVRKLTHGSNADFSPDGNWLLVGSDDAASLVSLRDLETSHAIRISEAGPVQWSPDGRWFVVTNRLFELPRLQSRGMVPVDRPAQCRFSRDGRTLATLDRDGAVRLFDMPQLSARPLQTAQAFSAIAMDLSGNTLATGHEGSELNAMLPGVSLWNVPNADLLGEFAAAAPVRAVEFTPDGSYLAMGLSDGRVQLVDIDVAIFRRHG